MIIIDITKFMIISEEQFNSILNHYGILLDKTDPNYLNTYFITNFMAYFLIIIISFIIYYFIHKLFPKRRKYPC